MNGDKRSTNVLTGPKESIKRSVTILTPFIGIIFCKQLRILDLGLPDWLIVIEKDKACDLSHSLEREGVCQGVRERSHAIPSKACKTLYIIVNYGVKLWHMARVAQQTGWTRVDPPHFLRLAFISKQNNLKNIDLLAINFISCPPHFLKAGATPGIWCSQIPPGFTATGSCKEPSRRLKHLEFTEILW